MPAPAAKAATSERKKGRRPKADRSAVATAKVDFAVTPDEKALLWKWAREDGCSKLSTWLREQVGLPSKPGAVTAAKNGEEE